MSATVNQVTPDAVAALIRDRRTIHDFRSDPAPREAILEAIEVARWAPNHLATEPWHFYLLGPETASRVARLNADLVAGKRGAEAGEAKFERWRNMPGWLVVTCDNSDDPVRAKEDYAACCCAVHNLSLYLWCKGIGVKWTTGEVTRESEFYELVWVDPDVETVVGMFWYGYAAEVPRVARKGVGEILVSLP